MIIGIDASRANRTNKTGTEWFSWHLIEELKKIVQSDDQVLLYTNNKLKGELGIMPDANWQEKILAWLPKYLWTQIRLWWELFLKPCDVLLIPAHTIPLLPIRKKTKVIAVVHDVGFKRWPELYKPIQIWYHEITMRRIKSRADVILTISNFSKKEIMDLYDIAPSRIKVVYLGYDSSEYFLQLQDKIDQVKQKYNIKSPYLLYVGRLEKKKNIGNIVKAFVLAKNAIENLTPPNLPFQKGEENSQGEILPPFTKGRVGEGLKLVLAGAGGNQYEEIKKIIADLKLEQEIILTGYVDQADLPALYSGSLAFIFPTLYEGFGLPILDAMASGTPVITSNTLPHTEVGGDAGIYADPKSPEAISDAIMKVVENNEFRTKVVASGFLRTKEFSWAKTAQEIYQIIKIV